MFDANNFAHELVLSALQVSLAEVGLTGGVRARAASGAYVLHLPSLHRTGH